MDYTAEKYSAEKYSAENYTAGNYTAGFPPLLGGGGAKRRGGGGGKKKFLFSFKKVNSLFFLPPPPTGTPPSRRRRSYAGCLRNLNQQDKPFFTLVVKKTPRSTSTKSFACESQFFHAVFLKKRDVFLIISHWHPFYLLLMHFPYCAGRNAGHNFPYEKGDVLRI